MARPGIAETDDADGPAMTAEWRLVDADAPARSYPLLIETPDTDDPIMAAERLLGSADEETQAQSYLPFTRQLSATGVVTGSLADSTAIAGVPAAAMLEALRALGTAIDLDRQVRTGDRFYVRYEQAYTAEAAPIGVGRILWVELRAKAKGTIAIHRFRTRDGEEQFWLPSGQAATPPPIRLPLDSVTVTSGFGMRADPLDHPTPPPSAAVGPSTEAVPEPPPAPPEPTPLERREINRAAIGFGMGSQVGSARDAFNAGGGFDVDRIMAARRVREVEAKQLEAEAAVAKEAAAANPAPPPSPAAAPPPVPRKLFMHVGVDLLAPSGAPVYAASDGTVTGAGPNGGYGNWIRINHAGGLTTVYGHLSRFAPGLEAGSRVVRGELIGFVGSTGRSTGAHLHFEVLADGRWINPINHPATQCGQLGGADLARFRKQVAAALKERDREAEAVLLAFHPHSATVRW